MGAACSLLNKAGFNQSIGQSGDGKPIPTRLPLRTPYSVMQLMLHKIY